MNINCNNLDRYWDRELAPGDRELFADHLAGCDACREAINEQQWIDDLLHASALAQLETPPQEFVESFRVALSGRIYISRLAAWTVAAAAVVLVATFGWMKTQDSPPDHAGGIDVVMNNVAAPNADTPVATFVGGPDVIAVPVASPHPDVTIVRLYPVFEPDYSAQASLDQTTMGDDFVWPDLNGG